MYNIYALLLFLTACVYKRGVAKSTFKTKNMGFHTTGIHKHIL